MKASQGTGVADGGEMTGEALLPGTAKPLLDAPQTLAAGIAIGRWQRADLTAAPTDAIAQPSMAPETRAELRGRWHDAVELVAQWG